MILIVCIVKCLRFKEMSKLRETLEIKNRDYFKIFESNIVKVKPILEKCTPIEYTFHGLKHCEKLEEYASQLISDDLFDTLNAEELFILLNGIYYHDLGMISYERLERKLFDTEGRMEIITQLISNRNEHNIISQEMIYNKDDNSYNSELISLPHNDPSFAYSISLLCLGHRNNKDENGKPINTLVSSKNIEHYQDVAIHTRTLTCILRLADELDITNQRAPSDVFIHLKSFINKESIEEWIKHEFFGKVDIISVNHEIYLRPHIQNIFSRDKILKDRLKTRILLFSKLAKINSEIDNIEEALENDSLPKDYKIVYKAKIFIDGECVTKDDKDLYKKELEKARDNESNTLNSEKSKTPYSKKEIAKEVVDYKELLLKGINKLKDDKVLISAGFFKIPSNYYCKFYINTNKIISNNLLLNQLSNSFLIGLKDIQYSGIIGIDKAGLIIGANLSIISNKPFTYAMYGKSENSHSIVFESNISNSLHDKDVVLITDVIASGTTLESAINNCKEKLGSNIKAICSIFSTSKSTIDKLAERYKVPIIIISNEFSFMLYSKDDIDKNEELKNEFDLLNKI
jgi:orotate phosphoribosyltransferase